MSVTQEKQDGNTKIEVETEKNFIKNNYTTEQLSSLIQNLDEVEV